MCWIGTNFWSSNWKLSVWVEMHGNICLSAYFIFKKFENLYEFHPNRESNRMILLRHVILNSELACYSITWSNENPNQGEYNYLSLVCLRM